MFPDIIVVSSSTVEDETLEAAPHDTLHKALYITGPTNP
jgi:hypothetical protein